MRNRWAFNADANGDSASNSELPGVLIVGCSGHARVIIDTIHVAAKYRVCGLIDSFKSTGTELLGYQVIGTEEDIPALVAGGIDPIGIVAIGDNWARARITARIRELQPDFQFVSAVHPHVCIADDVEIGDGGVIMAGAVVNTGSAIGPFSIVNTSCSVDHECVLGEYSSLAPGVITGGRVTVGAYSAIGIGVTVIHEVRIGEHTVVGAGSTVVEDIPDRVVAYGTPARIVRTRNPGDPYLTVSRRAKLMHQDLP